MTPDIVKFYHLLEKTVWPVKLCLLDLSEINWPNIIHLDTITNKEISYEISGTHFTNLDIPKIGKFRRLCWEFADCEDLNEVFFKEIPQMIKISSNWQFDVDYDFAYGCQRMNWAKLWGFSYGKAIVHDVYDLLEGIDYRDAGKIVNLYSEKIIQEMQVKLNEFSGYHWASFQKFGDYSREGCKTLLTGYTADQTGLFSIKLDESFSDQELAMIKLMASTEYSMTHGIGWRITNTTNTSLPTKYFNFPVRKHSVVIV